MKRGDALTSPTGSFSRDILGRTTNVSYNGGGSDTIGYTPEGWLSSVSGASFAYDSIGNTTSWSTGASSATLSYTGPNGSTKLGLPSSMTGSGDIGSYSFTYNIKHWLNTLTDTGKNKTFTYGFNTDSTLATLQYPNQTTLNQTWANKMLGAVTVTKGQDTFLDIDSTFDGNDKITSYDTPVYAGQGLTFSETNGMTYDALHRLSELTYGSNNKTLTYSYSATVGDVTSIFDSLLNDSYDFGYDTKGRISSVTYPGVQGTSSYTYNDTTGKGRLESVTYPGNRTMTLTWDGRDRITQISLNDNGTITDYYLAFNDLNQLQRITKSVGGLFINSWNLSYGPMGLEKAVVKDANNQVVLTQDYTVSTDGTILSMTYTPTGFGGGFAGELYMSYDPCGNLAVATDSTGTPQLSYAYDRSTGGITDVYNPGGIENIIAIGGKKGGLTLPGIDDDHFIFWGLDPRDLNDVGGGYTVVITPSGTGVGVTGPCGEVGTCARTDQEKYDLCMARCFTYGVDGIGDLNTNPGTDDFARENYGNWQIAKLTFNHLVREIIQHSNSILTSLGGFGVALLFAIAGAETPLIVAALWASVGVAAGVVIGAVVGAIDDGVPEVKKAFSEFKVLMIGKVFQVGGKWLGLSDSSTTSDFVSAAFECYAQEGECVRHCYDAVYGLSGGGY
jgi:YD repeat-containing protein